VHREREFLHHNGTVIFRLSKLWAFIVDSYLQTSKNFAPGLGDTVLFCIQLIMCCVSHPAVTVDCLRYVSHL
jgi:hypothetical protein